MNKKQVWKRILAGILSAGLCMGGVQVYADETEAALGRYLESDIALPEGVNPRYVASMQDGTLRLIGEAEDETGNLQMTLWDSRDEGASWDQAAALPEKFENAYFTDISLCADGSGAGITYHYDEEEDASRLSHVRFDAQGNAEEVPLPEEDWRSMQRFSANGDLVEMGIGGEVSIIDPETGEIRNTLVSEGGQNIGICGSTVVIVAQGQLQMYDLSTGDPVPVDSVLEESLYAERSDYSIVSSSSYPILFAEDEEGRLTGRRMVQFRPFLPAFVSPWQWANRSCWIRQERWLHWSGWPDSRMYFPGPICPVWNICCIRFMRTGGSRRTERSIRKS